MGMSESRASMKNTKPRIALVLGDPAGIGPELVARILAQPLATQSADVLVIAHEEEFRAGMRLAGVEVPYLAVDELETPAPAAGVVLLRRGTRPAGGFRQATSTAEAGRYALETLGVALDAVHRGHADAIVFAPLNKHALHLGGMQTPDELHWFAQQLGFEGPVCEFNVLGNLWTSRVTSHVALKDVSSLVTREGVVQAAELLVTAVTASGVPSPRIAVCGLNPHNGDNGSFGREEIDVIAPAVAVARSRGLPVEGPFAADTIFLKLQGDRPAYDGVVTMYHDQGQIAMKLMGFSRGVTVQGGLPIPITTPAHGTAFDIAGQGAANPSAMRMAFDLACRMAAAQR
jgi:4-hydroxythreonine-4-phosphate dehydrogenase